MILMVLMTIERPLKDLLINASHIITLYKTLGKLSDILHLNNRNNQLERWARPPRNVPLDV